MTGGWPLWMCAYVKVCAVFFPGNGNNEDVPGVNGLLYEEHLEQCLAHWKHSLNVTHCNDDEDVTQSERTKSRVQSSTY